MNTDTEAVSPLTPPSPIIDAQLLQLWVKYEEIAMHFNELMMRWRLQAIGGLAGLVTVAGFIVGDAATLTIRYRAMLILSGVLTCAWVGVGFIDLCYYRRLLKGAVDAILRLEERVGTITLSTRIEERAKWGGDWAPLVFYLCGFIPLAAIVAWAIYQLSSLPPTPPQILAVSGC